MRGVSDSNHTVGKVFHESKFTIPEYQRDYSWDKKQTKDFLDDIEFVLESVLKDGPETTVNHYFGTIVLEEAGIMSANRRVTLDNNRIIDGQQRLTTVSIFARAIINELRRLLEYDIEDEELKEDISTERTDIRKQYIVVSEEEKIKHRGLTRNAFEKVVVKNSTPKKSHTTSERVINAYNSFEEWFKSKRKSHFFDGDNPTTEECEEYYDFLQTVISVLESRFEVSIKMVEDEEEAARMFKVINGRGKDLTLFDMVRSHIVYCASRNSSLDAEDLYNKFNEVYENITRHPGLDDDSVDRFVNFHWISFTKESPHVKVKRDGPNSIHRRLEALERYANVRREGLDKFVTVYLSTLIKFSQVYPLIASPEVYQKEIDVDNKTARETLNRLHSLHTYPVGFAALAPLLLSCAVHRGVDSQNFNSLLTKIESFVFRYNIIKKEGASSYKTTAENLAFELFWSEYPISKYKSVFGDDLSWSTVPDNVDAATTKALDEIQTRKEKNASDDSIKNYLREQNVVDGEGVDGWGGFRKRKNLRFLLYEYERSLRNVSESADIRTFGYWEENYQLEHLVPVEAKEGDRFETHEETVNRLGNLALLSPEENNRASNKTYTKKQVEIYSNSPIHMLRELPRGPFQTRDVHIRSEKLIDFVLKRW